MPTPSASNRELAAVLERFLCPGGKLRPSPYVEATQCSALFGERPDPSRHNASLRDIVGNPDHGGKLESIVHTFLVDAPLFGSGNVFFSRTEYLDLYLAHYFPANLGKLQIVLLDLLRAGHFPMQLHLVDLGVGTGTSFVALIDFVLALGAMADLAGTSLPIQELSLRGYDRSPACLAYTKKVLVAFGQVLQEYGDRVSHPDGTSPGPALASAWNLVATALAGLELQQRDIGGGEPIEVAEPSLLVLSYVVHQLFAQGNVEQFETCLAGTGTDSQLIVLAPGSRKFATQLMQWRRSLLRRQPHWRPVLPCGQEFGVRLPASCDECWCARREDIHGSPIQRAYLDRLNKSLIASEPARRWQVQRDFERLSWSYCVFASQPHSEGGDKDPPRHSSGVQRYIGQRRSSKAGALEVAEETCPTAMTQQNRLVALCPACVDPTGCRSAVMVQEPGKVLPHLRFGELVVIENVDSHNEADVQFTMNRRTRVRPHDDLGVSGLQTGLPHYDAQPASLNSLAGRLFGFPALHDFQHKIIRRILEGRDTLGIAATGAGKTECFLLPALLLPGLTVVVSPLKSLMQDQWDRCDERYGLGALTTYINGDVPHTERRHRLEAMRAGRYKLAYFTPEQLARNYVLAALRQTAVSVLAIDEAHCVSQWGHDFRPDYLNMVRRYRACWDRQPVIVALTATASERVRRDLCSPALLDLDNRPVEEGGDVVFHGSNRLELDLIVRIEPDALTRSRHIVKDLAPFAEGSTSGSAIVFMPYTGSKSAGENECSPGVEPFAAHLEQQLGQRVSVYHGQMKEGLHTEVGQLLQIRWQRPDGGWGVYIFQRRDETFCASGSLLNATLGVWYRMFGRWEDLARYGRQFLFDACKALPKPPGSWSISIDPGADQSLGDLTGRDRRAEQRAFMRSERKIMVATKSFGMGIDKADIRLVIHHSPPGDLLSYAQEVGRGARDGNRGQVILYFTEQRYRTGPKSWLTDRDIQEKFLHDRYVRESDLRACIGFLRQCRRRLEVSDPWTAARKKTAWRTYAVFSFAEVEAYFDALTRDPTPAGLPRPYAWPPRKERHKVVQLTLDVLFKTVLPATARAPAHSLLESCQEVFTGLQVPILVDWHGLEDSNADLLREVLSRESIDRREFEDLCNQAVTGDLLPLARRLRHSVEDTVSFLLEASHWQVIRDLRLGRRWGTSGYERNWEVCLSPSLLAGEGIDAVTTAVMWEHQRRRDEDYRDWELMMAEYVGLKRDASPAPRCLRRVLLAFLNTGEDVVDAGCGACSSCCPDGDFIPLAERPGRIIAIPPELWSGLEAVRNAVDAVPDIEVLRTICAFLERAEGARWRHAVYLNTERMLREDSGSVGATALLICCVAHRWLEREEIELDHLFNSLWRRWSVLGSGLARLAELTAEVCPRSVVAAYWRARTAHAEDDSQSQSCWEALLRLPGVARSHVHEAASALSEGGNPEYALLAARTSRDSEEAERAYGVLPETNLCSATFVLDEAVKALDAVGSEGDRADTFVGLVVAAHRRGAQGLDLLEILDMGWARIDFALTATTLLRLLESFKDLFVRDSRWPTRFVSFLTREETVSLRRAILVMCVRFLEQAGSFADHDKDHIAAVLCRIDPRHLEPSHAERLLLACADRVHPGNAPKYGALVARAGVAMLEWWARNDPATCTRLLACEACACLVSWTILENIWNWAIEHQEATVVHEVMSLKLTWEGRAFRQLMVEKLMGQLLTKRLADGQRRE
jgi:superfamily II DNA helicase RecQ